MGDLFCGADPLVRAGRPRPAFLSKNQALATIDKPAWGPATDEGVRPTIYAGAARIGKTKWHWVANLPRKIVHLEAPMPLRRVFPASACTAGWKRTGLPVTTSTCSAAQSAR